MKQRIKWGLVKVPDQQGVFNVGGRLGAARGPAALAKSFAKFRPELPGREADRTLSAVDHDPAINHTQAAKELADFHRDSKNSVSIFIGGGHDHGYSQLLGIQESWKKHLGKAPRLGCINLDAHLDLRPAKPVITSGSPFWLALENGVLRGEDLVEFGIQPQCNATSLHEYARKHQVQVVPFSDLRFGSAVKAFERKLADLSQTCDLVVVSLDLDCLAQAYAPGVSAPVAEGFTPSEVFAMVEAAGRNSKVPSLGIFELNPEHDLDSRTAILGATAAYRFISEALTARG